MAITFKGAWSGNSTGLAESSTELTTLLDIPTPAEVAPGDILHFRGLLIRLREDRATSSPQQDTSSPQPEGFIQGRRTITSVNPLARIRVRWLPPTSGWRWAFAWTLVAHSGVNLEHPHIEGEPTPEEAADGAALVITTRTGYDNRTEREPGLQSNFPAWPNPTLSGGANPPAWPVHAQANTGMIATPRSSDPGLTVSATGQVAMHSTSLLDLADPISAPTFPPVPPMHPSITPGRFSSLNTLLLRSGSATTPDLDPAPPSGELSTTGSGIVIPEWVDATQVIRNPLITIASRDSDGELQEDEDPLDVQPVALDATFNSIGACTSAVAAFPEQPAVAPFQNALTFNLQRQGAPAEAWWAGVVRDVRLESGLWMTELTGFWNLLNEDTIQVDPATNQVTRPEHPALTDALWLSEGARAVPTPGRTWADWFQDTFRQHPNASWGVGPDRVFVSGTPESAGVAELDVDHPSVLSVTPGGFIFPPFVTAWWTDGPSGIVQDSVPDRGLLVPRRTVQSSLNEIGQLIRPKEADMPLTEGPSHTIVVAGIAVPPLLAVNLPNVGSQMVASARVQVTVGEEGSMPKVTTTLTTVALPFRRAE